MKAFDNVPHNRILAKIESYGIHKSVTERIKDFLTGRRQRVIVNGMTVFMNKKTSVIYISH